MRVRIARPDDAAAVYEVDASNDDPLQWDDIEECRAYLEWLESLDVPLIVAETGGKVIGEMSVWWGDDIPEFGKSLEISTLYIHRQFHRQGAGSALVKRAFEIAKKHNCDCLTVSPNDNSIGFYRKAGFGPRLFLQSFLFPCAGIDAPGGFSFTKIELTTQDMLENFVLQTSRTLHPRQFWEDHKFVAAHPPKWKKDSTPRRAIFAFQIDSQKTKARALAIYRLAFWKGIADEAELYLWSEQIDRKLLQSCIAFAGSLNIKTLSIAVHGETVDWLVDLGGKVTEEEEIYSVRFNA